MKLLDEVIEKLRELKRDGIAITSIVCSSESEQVRIDIGNLETRDIFDIDEKRELNVPEDLDLYHES